MGKLIYLNHTRLDIAFVMGVLNRHMYDLGEVHLQATNIILAYLKGTIKQTLLFKEEGDAQIEIFTYVDDARCIIN